MSDLPPEIDTSKPHPARVYDALIGGTNNFAADRETVARVLEKSPNARIAPRENRAFLGRAVRFLTAEAGLRQFLDIGSGLPTANSVHQVAQAVEPSSRVVYVDNDPLVLLHARALLTSDPRGGTAYIQADARDPEAILAAPDTLELLDFSQPVGLLLLGLLHLLADADFPAEIVATLLDALPSGSYLVASHLTTEHDRERTAAGQAVMRDAGITMQKRDSDVFAAMAFTNLELVPPGVVLVSEWRPTSGSPRPSPAEVNIYGGVARKPLCAVPNPPSQNDFSLRRSPGLGSLCQGVQRRQRVLAQHEEPRLSTANDHALAHDLAERAGRLLLDLRAEGGGPDALKDAGDRTSHEFLIAELAKARPADAVLSEEGTDNKNRLTADRVWIVDPLDGTREFGEQGRTDWAVHVALWERRAVEAEGEAGVVRSAGEAGELTAGAVALPAQNITLSTVNAAERAGGRGDSRRPSEGASAEISASTSGAQRPLRMVVSRTRASQLVKDVAAILNADLVPCGSAGAKAATVIQGENDVYLHSGGFYEWDTAAPVAVARAAGLHVSRIDGSDVAYNQDNPYLPDILVCRPAVAGRLLNAIREANHAI